MWIVLSLLAALSAALVVILSKAGLKNVDSNLAFAVQAVMIFIVSWSVIAWQGKFGEIGKIEGRAWAYLLLAGVITCISSLLTFAALKLGDASRVSPLTNVSLAISVLLAIVFLKEKITWQSAIGAVLMTVGAVVIAMSGSSGNADQ